MKEKKPRRRALKVGQRVRVVDAPRMGPRLAGRLGEVTGKVPGGVLLVVLDRDPAEVRALVLHLQRGDLEEVQE